MVAALFVLVLYAYHENADSRENIEYFAKHGLSHEFNGAHNVFVLNGPHTIQAHTATWRSLPHVAVLERSNTCYDFGAWGVGVEVAREKWKAKYTHYIILNASVRGPFLPLYARGDWWRVFVDQLGGASNVGLVGTTLNCWSSLAETHLQSMLLATHAAGFEQVMNWFLTCQESQTEAVSSGEIALSRAFLSHGFALQTLSLAFEDTIPRGNRRRPCDGKRLEQTSSSKCTRVGGIVTPAAALGGGGFAEKRLYDLCVRLLAKRRVWETRAGGKPAPSPAFGTTDSGMPLGSRDADGTRARGCERFLPLETSLRNGRSKRLFETAAPDVRNGRSRRPFGKSLRECPSKRPLEKAS
ncbi:hypothetical protein M885DRAFT_184565 [Pelagophyceae sp. CCMP2097]|nr:hypothetical protein M885DRAFT_184565 [Pelagophyceae sp. CCMP2097]